MGFRLHIHLGAAFTKAFPLLAIATVSVLLCSLPLVASATKAPGADPSATRALHEGRLDDAISLLQTRLAANPKDAAAHLLLCRAFYAYEQTDHAVTECEAAIRDGLGHDAAAQDWAGRAYGTKADHAGMFGGMSLAKKVHAAFEAAVAANPHDSDAVDDLSEFYIGAPGLVGGGKDKALALATRVEATLPQSAHRIRALVADKNDDPATAEREFRAAIAVANSPAAWFDLGHFFAKRKQFDQATTALHKAAELDRRDDSTLVDVASVLADIKRDNTFAQACLTRYLNGAGKTDAAPAPKAHVFAARLAARAGDKAKARAELNAALALARDYEPARKALSSL